MDALYLAGRIAFGLVFLMNGFGHFAATDQMAGYAESRGVKPGKPMVLLAGTALILGGLGVVLGIWIDLAALLLTLLMLSFAILMHPFWREPEESRMMEQTHFFKDLGLAGGALLLFVFARLVAASEFPLSITGAFFD